MIKLAVPLAAMVLFAGISVVERPRAARSAEPDPMVAAAQAVIDALSEKSRAAAIRGFDDPERATWAFIPGQRKGARLGDMDLKARRALHRLLRTALSTGGYLKATTVWTLERVLFDEARARGGDGAFRDPENYWFRVHGTPGDGPWGWKLEGHHLSLNFTTIKGLGLSATPLFFGTNPNEVRKGPLTGLRMLGTEEDLARAFLESLTPGQRGLAMIAEKAPADVLMVPARAELPERAGLPWMKLDDLQRVELLRLIETCIGAIRPTDAEREMDQVRAGVQGLIFSWAGVTERDGGGHYFRIQGDDFVLEYDNVQNGANHAHFVWRGRGDFGANLLRQHRKADHGK